MSGVCCTKFSDRLLLFQEYCVMSNVIELLSILVPVNEVVGTPFHREVEIRQSIPFSHQFIIDLKLYRRGGAVLATIAEPRPVDAHCGSQILA